MERFLQQPCDPRQASPLTLAFVGDAVFELFVRERLVCQGNCSVNKLHKRAVEQVCCQAQAQAAQRLLPLLTQEEEEAYRRGCIYDAWTETFRYSVWMEAFRTVGIDYHFYTSRERGLDEIFPWDFIDAGVTKDFLIREWKRAREGKITPNCRAGCSGCGAKSFGGGVCYEAEN